MSKQLETDSVIPLYHQLKEIIREQIDSGLRKPGDLVPSENQLMSNYGVSRNTAKKALEDLVIEGILYRVQGKGTFVATPKLEQSLSGFYSFSKLMKERGIPSHDTVLAMSTSASGARVAKHLSIPLGEPVIEVKRVRWANREPIMFETSCIPSRLAPGLLEANLEKSSLYDILHNDCGIYVTEAKETFEPVLMPAYEAKFLQVKEGYPALLLDRIAFDHSKRPVEYCRSIVRGDKCRFYTELL